VFGFAIEFRKKKLGKHACGTGNAHAKPAIKCVCPKKISKIIKFFLKMRKGVKAEQPFLVVCCSTKFVLFKSVCLLAKFFVLGYRQIYFP